MFSFAVYLLVGVLGLKTVEIRNRAFAVTAVMHNPRCTLTAYGGGQPRFLANFGFKTPDLELPNRRQVSFYVRWQNMSISMDVKRVHINSLENFIHNLRQFTSEYEDDAILWFRGEPDVDTPLLPKVFREKTDGSHHEENKLLQMFRMKAPSFGPDLVPPREATDQWLFLAQHVGLPTRLLDWTESALLGLYFALKNENPVIWMIDPLKLNEQSISQNSSSGEISQVFPLTWFDPPGPVKNIGVENIKGAWEMDYDGIDLPVAVQPTYIHQRMSAQRSVFTVHGARQKPIPEIVPHELLRKFIILPDFISKLLDDLHILGIHDSTAFPDLDGLASELEALY